MKALIVKRRSDNKYFQVEFYLTSIISVNLVDTAEEATMFYPDKPFHRERAAEFTLWLYGQRINNKNEVEAEEILNAPEPQLFSNNQIKDIKREQKELDRFLKKRK